MVKKQFALTLFVMAALTIQATAASIVPKTVKDFAAKTNKTIVALPAHTALRSNGEVAYQVYNTANDEGFVVVSADEIIAYGNKGSFDVADMPEGMKELLDACTAKKASAAPRKSPIYAHVDNLLSSEWGQDAPYNMLTPLLYDSHCHTGCVATASSQIMYYYQWPKEITTSIPSYEPSRKYDGFEYSDLPPTSFDWEAMLPKYTGDESEENNMAVAKLMKYAGYAAKMNYMAASGSSVASVGSPLRIMKDYFDYSPAMSMVSLTDYAMPAFEKIVYDELTAGRPVLMSGANAEVGKAAVGHQFICDGYDDGFFHINWGYSSKYDTYYKFNGLQADYDYKYRVRAVIGIKPNDGNEEAATPRPVCEKLQIQSGYVIINSYVYEDEGVSFSVGIGYVDEVTGKIILCKNSNAERAGEGSGYSDQFSLRNLKLEKEKTYQLVPVFCYAEEGYSPDKNQDWQTFNPFGRYVQAKVDERGNITATERRFEGLLKMQVLNIEDNIAAEQPTEVKVQVTNFGDKFLGNIYFKLQEPDGSKRIVGSESAISLDYGDTKEFTVQFTPRAEGNHTFYGVMEDDGLNMGCVEFTTNSENSIMSVEQNPENGKAYYSTAGVKLQQPSNKGIYIHNGKKVLR